MAEKEPVMICILGKVLPFQKDSTALLTMGYVYSKQRRQTERYTSSNRRAATAKTNQTRDGRKSIFCKQCLRGGKVTESTTVTDPKREEGSFKRGLACWQSGNMFKNVHYQPCWPWSWFFLAETGCGKQPRFWHRGKETLSLQVSKQRNRGSFLICSLALVCLLLHSFPHHVGLANALTTVA